MAGSTGQASTPLIGVTTYLEPAAWGAQVREAALLPRSYARAIEDSGGIAALLPPSGRAATELVARIDGLVLPGGGPLDSGLYGAARDGRADEPQPQRDRFEMALARAAVEANLPLLGIGRGMHVLNVAREGTLIQHLPEVVGHNRHAPGASGAHDVQISASSALGGVLGDAAGVPAHHHQAVRNTGNGVVATAWADDQVIEAIELPEHRFALGVQWHPEETDDLRLFKALVSQAAGAARQP